MQNKRVVIVDSNPDFNKIYRYLITGITGVTLINAYDNIQESINRLRIDRPDLIVVGLDPAEYDRIDLFPKIGKLSPFSDLLLISDFLEENLLDKAVQYGVSGYLLRSSSLIEIEEAIQVVLQGLGFINGKVAKTLMSSFFKNTSSPLTRRESEVMHYLSLGKTYGMIAEDMKIADGTVKIHVKHIYRKLQVSNKAGAIAKAREIKLLN